MKQISPNEGDPSLDRLLSEWDVKASLPPRFQERVWQRIALAEARSARSGFADVIGRIQALLSRPGLAAGYVTALLALGFVVGWTRGLEKSAQLDQALGSRYVQVIDPYHNGLR